MGDLARELECRLTPAEIKFVESKLYSYMDSKKAIEAWEQAKEDIINETPTLGPGMPKGSGVGRPTENKAIRLMLLEQKAERERFWVTAIEDVLEILPEEDYKLVKLKYFDQYLSNYGVAKCLNISESSFYRRRDRILWRFASRFGIV